MYHILCQIIARAIKHWNKLGKEVVYFPSFDVFRLDVILEYML